MLRALALVALVATSACGSDSVRRTRPPEETPQAVCGDGRVDEGEQCDGSNLGENSCTSLGFDLGTLSCSATCTLATGNCIKLCGDGQIGPGEECDGNLGPLACGDWGYKSCNAQCKVDALHCRTTAFVPSPSVQQSYGGRAVLTDLSPTGYGELVTAVPEYFRFQVHAWDATRGFTSGRVISRMNDGVRPVFPIAADLDGDGDVDLAATNEDGTADRYRYDANSFATEPLLRLSSNDAGVTCPASRWLGHGELDGVPGAELVALGCPEAMGTESWSSVHVFPGGAAPGMARLIEHVGVLDGTLADMNGDGVLDLLILEHDAELVVRAGPALEADAPLAVGADASQMVAADLDGDGDADPVVATTDQVIVLENTGAAVPSRLALPAAATELSIADLDLDGRPDLFWFEASRIEIRRNLGAFTFDAVSVPVGTGSETGTLLSLSAGDLEGDGDPDLAVTIQPQMGSDATTTFLLRNQVQ